MAEVSNTKAVRFYSKPDFYQTFDVKGEETLFDCCKRMAQVAEKNLEKMVFAVGTSNLGCYYVWLSADKMAGFHHQETITPNLLDEATWAKYKMLSMEEFVGLQNITDVCIYEKPTESI